MTVLLNNTRPWHRCKLCYIAIISTVQFAHMISGILLGPLAVNTGPECHQNNFHIQIFFINRFQIWAHQYASSNYGWATVQLRYYSLGQQGESVFFFINAFVLWIQLVGISGLWWTIHSSDIPLGIGKQWMIVLISSNFYRLFWVHGCLALKRKSFWS